MSFHTGQTPQYEGAGESSGISSEFSPDRRGILVMACLPDVGVNQEALADHLAPETTEIVNVRSEVLPPRGLEPTEQTRQSLVRFTEDTFDQDPERVQTGVDNNYLINNDHYDNEIQQPVVKAPGGGWRSCTTFRDGHNYADRLNN